MSGDNKSMTEILREIREIVAEDEGADGERAGVEARSGQPVRMIGFEVGLLALAPPAALAMFWGIGLNGWLGIAEPFDSIVGVILLFILVITADTNFRRPDGPREWAVLLAVVLLAAMACTTTMSLTDWVLQNRGGDIQLANWWPARLIAGLSALAVTLWTASRLTRSRNLILPREHGVDTQEGDAG